MRTVYYGGRITTMDPDNPFASAVVCEDGRFIFAGSDNDALRIGGSRAVQTDLCGAAAYPGFQDSHLHILNKAVTSRELELQDAKSRDDVLSMLEEACTSLDAPAFINGRGFNEDLWEDRRLPSKAELDRVSHGKPAMLTRVCGHTVLVNSMAMELSGVTNDTPQVPGGHFDTETGVFSENAIGLIDSDCGDKSTAKCKELLYSGMKHARENGLTCIHTDDFGTFGFSMETVVQAYRELESEGRMPVRVIQQCALPSSADFSRFIDAGHGFLKGSCWYRIGPRKLYIDGSLGARTALLSVPYADAPDKQGIAIYTRQELLRLAKESHKHGMPFICHAIGDAGVSLVLDAIEYAREAVPGTDRLPDGIVHCQITSADELRRIRDIGAVVYAQPVFTEYDLHICRDRVGAELEKTSYNWKTLYDCDVTISSGSDCPVETLNPAANIFCAVTRKDFELYPDGGWLPEQRLSVEEAIACHTVLAARSVCLEHEAGMIKAGYLADMTVYPERLEDMVPEQIKQLMPVMTVVGGKRDFS